MGPQLPDFGCFPRWPENGYDFVHPDDHEIVLKLIPSERVMRREHFDGAYYHYSYGSTRFRLKPCLWLKVKTDGIDIGDSVETVGVNMERERFVAKVYGMYYIRRKGCILYRLRRDDTIVPNLYLAEHLRLLTEKAKVRRGEIPHPTPKAFDRSERLEL
ncbi:hypothetical protein Q31b_28910 [Novipirellula aureliae]|uniref:Uncharacterized protein n=1 Tax=Novipirellula aureliae TaxID=2527966 RepID=A0A5C6DYY4_9BACT|nr:hypothetical protein [Novipirellula aureliae]TWU41444.1 hypothetical protein Q31b_28910 [Novipirellula aureliae]